MDETASEIIIRENKWFDYDSIQILTPKRKAIVSAKLCLTACNYCVPIADKIIFNLHVPSHIHWRDSASSAAFKATWSSESNDEGNLNC
jgi:hypothetical protein